MGKSAAADDTDFLPEFQVYEPHRTGLPPLRPYVRELWKRRHFAAELSRANMRAANTRTFFGQIWLVLNPLLLACVYYVLTQILSHHAGGLAFMAHLVAGIFAYYYVSGTISTGASSVTGSGALISNIAFPRLLMPLAALRTGFFRFLPTVPVYLVLHVAAGQPLSWKMLLGLYFLGCLTLLGAGLAAVFAAAQVYFRDVSSFLPYLLRIWLYMSPVIWFPEQVPARIAPLMRFNPLYSMLGGWTDLVVRSDVPALHIWVTSAAWAGVVGAVGCLFFVSREREFAVRL
jgi:teichoic acid transport system permease protein